MSKKICVIDYGMGNLRSVAKAAELTGAEVTVTSEMNRIMNSDAVILPGVGSFDAAVKNLKRIKLWHKLSYIIEKKPFLGICLGFQLLFEKSEEGSENGLGIFKGIVRKFDFSRLSPLNSHLLKIPHMGWNSIEVRCERSEVRKLFKGILNKSYFYFVHSYYVIPNDKKIVASTTDYTLKFCSSILRDKLYACQFHPEKSGELGLKLIKNFLTFDL